MLKQHLFQPHPVTHVVSRNRETVPSAPPAPTQNHLLAALPRDVYSRLLAQLQLVPLALDESIYESGKRQEYLYFLVEGIAAQQYITASGAPTGCALTGSEGMVGISIILGGESTPYQMRMLTTGYAYRLRANLLKQELVRSDSLLCFLLRYIQAQLTQTAQITVCNRLHSVEQKLCHWILSCLDRLPANALMITQERMANLMGVRRESVTEAASILKSAGLLLYHRGRIVVPDRPQLEARACECHAVVKREFARLLPRYR